MSLHGKKILRQSFAWVQMVFAVIMAICSIRFYAQVQEIAMAKEISAMAKTTESYTKVVVHGRAIYEKTYSTIPQHKRSLQEVCKKINSIEKVCKKISDKVPSGGMVGRWEWVKDMKKFPMEMFKPFGEIRKSLQETIAVMNDIMRDDRQRDIRSAFTQTEEGLREVALSLRKTELKMAAGSWITLMMLLAMSVCFFANGAIVIASEKK